MFSLKEWWLIFFGSVVGSALFVGLFYLGFSPLLLICTAYVLTCAGILAVPMGFNLFDWKCLFIQAVGLGAVVAFGIFGILDKF
ncbi:MAG: hypothetical protein WC878_03670 [Candidatus Paceibacterota bacterium]|jgi:hypothetical protein